MTRAVDVASRELPPNTALGTRNLIINGDMRIAQRGTSSTYQYANGYYTADRWKMSVDNSWYSEFNIDVVTDAPDGQGFANALKYSIGYNGGNGGGANLKIQQRIEGQNIQHLKKGTSNAESLTLSFWVKSNKTGTYIAELYDVDNTRSISKSYTINAADTWEKKTITYAGDTTGAFGNDNNASLDVNLFLIAASAYTSGTLQTSWGTVTNANRAVGQVNFLDNNSNYYIVTGVQLEVGENATEFEHRPYDMELARCQRYYQQGNAYMGISNDPELSFDFQHRVTMRHGSGVRTGTKITGSYTGTLNYAANVSGPWNSGFYVSQANVWGYIYVTVDAEL